jgi:hypothetical protein
MDIGFGQAYKTTIWKIYANIVATINIQSEFEKPRILCFLLHNQGLQSDCCGFEPRRTITILLKLPCFIGL